MALEIKQQLKLAQQLRMTPQLQQAIKLLQLSRMELVELVRKEMEENPVLEETQDSGETEEKSAETDEPGGNEPGGETGESGSASSEERAESSSSEESLGLSEPIDPVPSTDSMDEGFDAASALAESNFSEQKEVDTSVATTNSDADGVDWDAYLEHHSLAPSLPASAAAYADDLPPIEANYTRRQSLSEHLIWQLRMQDLDEQEECIGLLIIGNIDPSGYLTGTTIEEIAAVADVPLIVAEDVLLLVHTFDPVGVGARSLEECLLIQAKYVGQDDEIVRRIISEHMSNLERKNYPAIAKALGEPLDEIIEAVKVISTFEPKPGRSYSEEEPLYITPDVYVHRIGDEFFVVPNDDGLPKLRISNFYRSALAGGAKERQYVQEKLRAAQWLIRSIQQRQRTIIRVTESIVKFQRDFFIEGIAALKPLILRDVAEDIGMHESTVSRVTTNKYVHTPQGIFELKFFFNSGINRMDGDDVASESVKSRIKDIISGEDGRRPYSDQKLVEMLRQHNIDIARRTVAKYREQLRILSSSKRKQLF